ncbi:uncharacterized protein SPAPADRAFT_59466, partial [Spathaspora passalidarum NRRL Y-27907]
STNVGNSGSSSSKPNQSQMNPGSGNAGNTLSMSQSPTTSSINSVIGYDNGATSWNAPVALIILINCII